MDESVEWYLRVLLGKLICLKKLTSLIIINNSVDREMVLVFDGLDYDISDEIKVSCPISKTSILRYCKGNYKCEWVLF